MENSLSGDLQHLITRYQSGDKNIFLEIYQKFLPLVKKYSRKLNYDGSNSDMVIALLEIVQNIPIINIPNEGALVAYINKAIINKFFYLYRKNHLISLHEIELNSDLEYEIQSISQDDRILIHTALAKLTKKEKKVLVLKYIKGYSDIEIAQEFNVSRQAINKTKNKALRSIRALM